MNQKIFSNEDIHQIQERGMTLDGVLSQIEAFRRGFPKTKLKRPCTVGDGITVLGEEDMDRLAEIYSGAALSGRAMKFVPASGAASRMFKLLLSFNNRYDEIDERRILAEAAKDDPDHRRFIQFIQGIRRFAFYDELKWVMSRDGLDAESLISQGQYKDILEYLLFAKGLGLATPPKGLIKFHLYPDSPRTPFEEHLVEAAAYTKDRSRVARVHFTIAPEHEAAIKAHIREKLGLYESRGVRYVISFSFQSPSTDTVAVDLRNRPFRDEDGGLLFRPGGHGALLKNLWELEGDIVFIKNIDNVVPDRLKPATYVHKRALGGYLVELQRAIFGYLKRLLDGDDAVMEEGLDFLRDRLSVVPPGGMAKGSKEQRRQFLIDRLNRPLRVCGMVKNVREPGGGPFWVEHSDRSLSKQIVESSQVDMASDEQRSIWESSTHFNPVDLVCGVRDYSGRPFDLMDYTDPNTGFITTKSKGGREIKALELPGLWNGAMAYWNTVFVEVPVITFNPVKTVTDLLREEHQPD